MHRHIDTLLTIRVGEGDLHIVAARIDQGVIVGVITFDRLAIDRHHLPTLFHARIARRPAVGDQAHRRAVRRAHADRQKSLRVAFLFIGLRGHVVVQRLITAGALHGQVDLLAR